jgi:hypothetical protein
MLVLMRARKKMSRKVLLAVPVVWSVITTMQSVASGADGGSDAGADASMDRPYTGCTIAPTTGAFGTTFGAGCC